MNDSKPVQCGHLSIYPVYTNSSSGDMASDITACVVNIILSVLTTIGNLSVMMAYFKNSNLQTKSNTLIVALAFSDLVVGLWVQPSFVWVKITEMNDAINCALEIINDLSTKFCIVVSMVTLGMVVSAERYLAIFHPLKHRTWLTERKLLGTIAVVWISVTIFVVSIPLGIPHRVYRPLGLALILLSLLSSLSLYLKIAKKVRQMKCRTNPRENITGRKNNTSQGSARENTPSQQIRTAVTLFYVLGALCVSHLPMVGGFVYASICGQDVIYQKFLWTWGVTFLFLNSFCNPFIYSWRNRYMSTAIRRLFVKRESEKSSELKNRRSLNLLTWGYWYLPSPHLTTGSGAESKLKNYCRSRTTIHPLSLERDESQRVSLHDQTIFKDRTFQSTEYSKNDHICQLILLSPSR